MDILNTKIKQILTEKTTKIIPENIKSGVNILGIDGSVIELKGEVKTVNPTTNQQIIIPTSTGKNALTQVTVNAVTNTIDNNIVEGNIKSGVSILGVQGSSKVLDTTDSNAIANDIVTGKTAFVNGEKIIGTYTGIIPTGTININENEVVDVTNYASANVNVSSGGGKNVQINSDMFYAIGNGAYTHSGLKLTVSKTGTYTVKWFAFRTSTSYDSFASALYIDGVSYNQQTSWGAPYIRDNATTTSNQSSFQNNKVENVQLQENQVIEIYSKSRNSSYLTYVGFLILEEE